MSLIELLSPEALQAESEKLVSLFAEECPNKVHRRQDDKTGEKNGLIFSVKELLEWMRMTRGPVVKRKPMGALSYFVPESGETEEDLTLDVAPGVFTLTPVKLRTATSTPESQETAKAKETAPDEEAEEDFFVIDSKGESQSGLEPEETETATVLDDVDIDDFSDVAKYLQNVAGKSVLRDHENKPVSLIRDTVAASSLDVRLCLYAWMYVCMYVPIG